MKSNRPPRPRFESEAQPTQTQTHNQIYGVNPIVEALRAAVRPLERIMIATGAHDYRFNEIYDLAKERDVPVRRVAREELDRMMHVGGDRTATNHQGIIAIIAAAQYADTDALLDSLTAKIEAGETPLVVVLDEIEDPRNLGAILRTAECAGVDAVFIPERRAAGLTETVAKAAAGALEYVHIARVTNIADLIAELKRRGVWTVATDEAARVDYTSFDWRVPVAVVLGNEGDGVRRLVRERCDATVRLPLRGHIESLNVSVAAGIVMYEILRQRTQGEARAYK
ncbi:MAG: 23S rRNA (guanosine(2251)-2'-O)-methyltransferase RlmB [Pyrinomonadaceae bacterium MAG19_C2-C3]|nr:23S rRNA (guanosine(2251)-2'-O)-methyltransferase RlmB [Pyrinomonadaceae bacterium MAG19_C2-C3]